jgi:hypothetical protein
MCRLRGEEGLAAGFERLAAAGNFGLAEALAGL